MEFQHIRKIKGQELFESDIDSFCTRIKEIVEKIKPEETIDGKVYLCAISRKAPRLLEILKKSLATIWDKLYIFTEIALPFMKLKDVSTIILMDDAIYFGSTFTHYYNVIKSYNENINIIPICCIKASEVSLSFDKILKSNVHPREYGLYFVKSLAEKFCEEFMPFEIEFPAFEIELLNSTHQNLVNLYNELYQKTNRKIYKITEIEDNDNDDACIEFGWNLTSNEENSRLKKIRFYICGKRLVISSITTNDITQSDLDNINWHNDFSQELWDVVKKDIDSLYEERVKDNAYYGVLCVWYNYICSILLFLTKKRIIIDVIKKVYKMIDVNLKIDNNALSQIIGNKNAVIVNRILLNFLHSQNYESELKIFKSEVQVYDKQEFLPSKFEYRDYYYAMQKKYITQCRGSLEEELCCLIYLQRVMIDKMNRSFIFLDNERLKYGHTFSSINSIIEMYDKRIDKTKELKIHAYIDRYIDVATIVPQYIAITTEQYGRIWIRVMRSGENEPSFVGFWCRLYLFYLKKILLYIGYNKIERRLFENIMSWLYFKFQLKDYTKDDVLIKYKYSSFQLCTSEGGNDIPISERMIRLSLLKLDPMNYFISLNDDLLDIDLIDGIILPKKLSNQIWDSLKILIDWNKKCVDNSPIYLFFNLYFRGNIIGSKSTQKMTKDNISVIVDNFIKHVLDNKLEISNDIIYELGRLYNSYFRNQYNKISINKTPKEIPLDNELLMEMVEIENQMILKSEGKFFLDMICNIMLTNEIEIINKNLEYIDKLNLICSKIENVKDSNKERAKMFLEEILKSGIVNELFG